MELVLLPKLTVLDSHLDVNYLLVIHQPDNVPFQIDQNVHQSTVLGPTGVHGHLVLKAVEMELPPLQEFKIKLQRMEVLLVLELHPNQRAVMNNVVSKIVLSMHGPHGQLVLHVELETEQELQLSQNKHHVTEQTVSQLSLPELIQTLLV